MNILSKYNNKKKAALILLIVMLIIVFANFNTLRNSKNVNENINAIYKDRLVVAHYIFRYSNELNFIKNQALKKNLTNDEKEKSIITSLKRIHIIDSLYVKTVLTPKEKIHFENFLLSCATITRQAEYNKWYKITQSSDEALKSLFFLSGIQLEEGKIKLTNANSMYNNNNALGQLQIALLVVLGGITFFLLIIKKNKKSIKIPESPSMN